jgi:hypothetical protein
VANWNVRLTPKALGAKAATLEAERAKRRTFIVAGTIEGLSPKQCIMERRLEYVAVGGR